MSKAMLKVVVEQCGWSNIEELLRCPVCLEPPYVGSIMQCRTGHNVCYACQQQLAVCPLCKSPFTGTRNFAVEELIQNFLVLKNALLLVRETAIKSLKTCMTKAQSKKVSYTIPIDKGLYPCRVDGCNTKLPIARLLNHVRTFHENVLLETKMDDNKEFNKTWEFSYDNSKPITRTSRAVFVSGIGLVFLNIEMLKSGHTIVIAQMAAQLKSCRNFKVTLRVYYDNWRSFSHTTSMYSCRENMTNLLYKKACLLMSHKSISSVLRNKKFNCSIQISPNPNGVTVVEPMPSMHLTKIVHENRDRMCLEEVKFKLMQEMENNVKSKKRHQAGVKTVIISPTINGTRNFLCL